jgi:hyperosmotically inducible protein
MLMACFLLLASAISSKATAGQSHSAGAPAARSDSKPSPPLAREIRHQLAALPFYSVFDFISFTLEGRKVTLTGQSLRPALKRNAVAAIESLEGVETVVDQIEVLPNSPADNELRRGVYRAIFEDPALAPYAAQAVPAIHILVKNGSVALEGTVKTAADKSLAATRASGVANVTGVRNNLNVRAGPTAGDRGDAR